jgi:hypothetical protein
MRIQSTITANETKIGLHLRFGRLVPFNEQGAASECFSALREVIASMILLFVVAGGPAWTEGQSAQKETIFKRLIFNIGN